VNQYFFVGRGVRIDTGMVVNRKGRQIDVAALINSELQQEGDEYLHLRFDRPSCTATGFDLPFSGSRIGKGEQGSAEELAGTVVVDTDGEVSVTIEG
jgi:hypothetical protein